MGDVRPAAVAGTWYPAARGPLERAVEEYLAQTDDRSEAPDACPSALIAPHAGLVYSGPVAAYAYKRVSSCDYRAAAIVGPSHFVGFDGVAIWPRGSWETPFGSVAVDGTLAAAIAEQTPLIREYPVAHMREHSLDMQMPFVAKLLPGVPIVPMVMGHQTRATAWILGEALARAIANRQQEGDGPVLLIASSDLSHYQNAQQAARMDGVVAGCVDAFDPEGLMDALEREPGHACGGGPMVAVLCAARALGATRARVLRYADSGDVSGDKSAVVGYMAAAVW